MSQIINVNDFVVASKLIEDIQYQSVGLVKEINSLEYIVFFIGKKKTVTTTQDEITFLDIKKTGKPYPVKICNICHILKNEDDFEVNQTDAKGRKTTRPSCKLCRVDIDGVAFKRSESLEMDKIKPSLLFTCPICEKMSIVGVTANLVKDHDHKTGMGREWICDSCNTGLGRFKDDIGMLEKVIMYLKKHNHK